MLLVDDDEAEVLERDARAEQPVGADDDVDLAGREAFGDGRDLAVGAQARNRFDVHGPVRETVAERLVMLLGQERRGRQHRDLLAGRHRDERRAHGDLGLAEPHVAADQAVGGAVRAEVLDDRVDGGLLVGRGLEREPVAEAGVVVLRPVEHRPGARRAPPVDVEQFRGDVVGLAGGAPLGLVPLVRSEAVQGRVIGVRAGVAGDEVQRRDRHVEPRFLGVFEGEELLGVPVDLQGLEPEVAADAVVDVHDRRADGQFRQVADHEVRVDPPGGRTVRGVVVAAPEQFRLRDNGEVGQPGAALDVGDRGRERETAGDEFLEGRHVRRAQAGAGEELLEVLGAPGGLCREEHGLLARLEEAAQQARLVPAAVARGEVGQGTPVETHAVPVPRAVGVDLYASVGFQYVAEALPGQVQRGWRQDRPLDVVTQGLVTRLQLVLEVRGLGHGFRVEDDDRRRRHVVEQRGGLLEEERQVVLDAGMRDALADVLVDRAPPHVDIERAVPAVAKARDALGIQGDLPRGQHAYRLDPLGRALGVRVERPQGLDAVIEQVDAQRRPCAHGEDVHQRTPHRVLASFGHGAGVAVAGPLEARALEGDLEALARAQRERVGVDEGGRREPLHERADGRDEHAPRDAPEVVQGGQPVRHDVLVRREAVVGQRLPVGERVDGHLAGRVEVDLVADALGALGVAGGVQHERVRLGGERRGPEAGAAAEERLPVMHEVAGR